MEPELVTPELKSQIEHIMGSYGWFILIAFVGVLFKDVLHKAVEGFMIFIGHDFDNDDMLYISGRAARIVRVGLFRTVFYMVDRDTKMVVPNDRLKTLTIEKRLNRNGSLAYLFKGGEKGFEEQQDLKNKEGVKKEN
jgi:hypothetical protein